MPRRTPIEGAEPRTIDQVDEWHRNVVDALALQLATVRRAIRDGSVAPARFELMTEEELVDFHDRQRRELDRLTVLNLVASVEAAIWIDFRRRVQGKLKDPLALVFREWHKSLSKRKRERPDFDEGGVLDLVKQEVPAIRDQIGQYRECLRARHWIGHGRHFARPTAVDRLVPEIVAARCRSLLDAWPR